MRAALLAALACGCWTGPVAPAAPPPSNVAPVAAPPAPPPASASVSPPDDAAITGFDLYVAQSGVTTWRIDGEVRTDRLPVRIRGIAPGPHEVEIDAPPGFTNATQAVDVELGKAPKVMIELVPASPATAQP
ncbi:MAG TPA: hypothetical protein VGG74_23360 [Kofleriaceae bacterium]|jgi:hypothetical protein